MAVPFTSLDAATVTGPGTAHDLGELADHHSLLWWSEGGPSSRVDLEGSHDGEHWFSLAVGSGGFALAPASSTPGVLVRYVRANLVTLTGGSSPTVTATIASDTEEE